MPSSRSVTSIFACAIAVLGFLAGNVAAAAAQDDDPNTTVDASRFDGLQYRSLNFSRGGRSTAVSGVADDPLTYYFGGTGGGVWKTRDAGVTWNNISDGYFGVGSIGAIALAPSDANVLYVGTGEACPRGNVSIGEGMFRSTDAGKTWDKVLSLAGQIGKIVVHPDDPDLVWAAVLGNIFGASEDRGVYRSRDGGTSWEKVLYIDDDTGVVDIEIDPNNSRILLASAWTAKRTPWTIDSGSADDGIYRTKDGGNNWERLSTGLPTAVMGKTSVAISPANSERVWALIEAADGQGGVYRSDDGGDSFRRVNSERKLLQRAWYYIHIYADPQNEDAVYALNTGFYKSTDGGATFPTQFRVPHGDNHDLWINPTNPKVMINSNDGGANVSFTGGSSWSHQRNQPTAQFYRVSVDTTHPYRVYGAQQDNSTVRVSSRTGGGFGGGGGGFGASFDTAGGGESGHIAIDRRNNEVVYAGSYGGSITRRDMVTELSESVRAYPESQTGQQALDMKYRFQWNAPIRISPHDPNVVYHTSQYVHRSTDNGHSWETISPDLSHNDPETQGYSGAPISRDNTGVEVFNTIFAFEESTHTPGLLWAGTDDGRMWRSDDAGGAWTEITPDGMPQRGTVNMIDVSAHDPGRIHIAVYKYRENDMRPYIYRTNDYGATWDLLTDGTNGIPADHFVRVVREDPNRRGLLYAGTEFGMYVSFDDGAHWQSLQLNLPIVPITDMLVHRGDLVVATQGRAFWILDNITPLSQIDASAGSDPVLFAPRRAYRGPGESPTIDFYVSEVPEGPVKLEILDAGGAVVREFSSEARSDAASLLPLGVSIADVPARFRRQLAAAGGHLDLEKGFNRVTWDGRHKPLFTQPRGIVMWGGRGGRGGPKAVPGTYQVKLTIGEWSQTQSLQLDIDPRFDTTPQEYEQQYELAVRTGERLDELWKALTGLRSVKQQLLGLGRTLRGREGAREIAQQGRAIADTLGEIEAEITQVEGEGGQDALNFPGRLDNQWAVLFGAVSGPDTPITAASPQRFEDLQPQTTALLDRLHTAYGELDAINEQIAALELDAVTVPSADRSGTPR